MFLSKNSRATAPQHFIYFQGREKYFEQLYKGEKVKKDNNKVSIHLHQS
jgi:hypothetical protein